MASYVPGDELAVATDTLTFASAKKPAVMVALVLRGDASVVLAIDASEYDGVELANRLGWPNATTQTAHEAATAQLDASSKRR